MSNMMCLGVYLSDLSEEEYTQVQTQMKPFEAIPMPLLSWDIFSHHFFKIREDLKIENDIKIVKTFAKQNHWKNEIDVIFKNQDFEALIITDSEQNIIWVNDGFSKMTGYSKAFAVNKKPYFLQGNATSEQTKNRIRKGLTGIKPFKEVLTNYRKDKSPYECEVKIIPLYNEKVTHFLAIEKSIG